ncbi:hypothetical protein [Actinotignum urinale]|uniref:Uncharacterized protein n=1 Tax=Actinotignum urinale TaxID=190146 RepID=A0ABU5G6Y6_9ACTO|nr:hypothetical protein [Actinotignum urinale]MDY5133113.1 hypothetical protein [Actinotignum urinale]MDY5160324.1 hypothetical protein [Actinotignum urinale]
MKISSLFKAILKTGPVVAGVLLKYGPQLKELAQKNPRLVEKIHGVYTKIAGTAPSRSSAQMASKIVALKEQVTYLYANATTPKELEDAKKWREELDMLERAIPVVDTMRYSKKKMEQRAMYRRLNKISDAVLAATLVEYIEDAEIVDDEKRENA